jgi:hypothetical protein
MRYYYIFKDVPLRLSNGEWALTLYYINEKGFMWEHKPEYRVDRIDLLIGNFPGAKDAWTDKQWQSAISKGSEEDIKNYYSMVPSEEETDRRWKEYEDWVWANGHNPIQQALDSRNEEQEA